MGKNQNKMKEESKTNQATKFHKLIEHLKALQGNGFTGYVRINFSQGNIGRVEKFEEILKR
jgi:hypothetical protein